MRRYNKRRGYKIKRRPKKRRRTTRIRRYGSSRCGTRL